MRKILLFIIAVFMLSNICFSLDIALTPGTVDFGTVLREGFSQGSFKFSTYSTTPVRIILYQAQPDNIMNEWINMHLPNGTQIKVGDKFTIDKDHPLIIFTTFEPKNDAPNGDYSVTIGATIESGFEDNISANEGETVAKIRTGISVKLHGIIDDVESLSCAITNMQLTNPELGEPVSITGRVQNTGNIIINPKIEVDVWNKDKTKLIRHFEGNLGLIKPTISTETQFDLDSTTLGDGEYLASISLKQCNANNKLISFRIFNIGTKSLEGRIKYIDIPSIIYGFNPVHVKVTFENFGSDATVARFSGGIYKDNILISTLDSERLSVKPKESIELDAGFFTPSQTKNAEDRYILKGTVYYSNKQTEEFVKVFFVRPKEEKQQTNFQIGLIFGIVIIIIILISLILLNNKNK